MEPESLIVYGMLAVGVLAATGWIVELCWRPPELRSPYEDTAVFASVAQELRRVESTLNTLAIGYVLQLTYISVHGERDECIRTEAKRILPLLQQRYREENKHNDLLRPILTLPEGELLRPSSQVDTVPAVQLLRAKDDTEE